jgi:hypothetical protein
MVIASGLVVARAGRTPAPDHGSDVEVGVREPTDGLVRGLQRLFGIVAASSGGAASAEGGGSESGCG